MVGGKKKKRVSLKTQILLAPILEITFYPWTQQELLTSSETQVPSPGC